MVNFKISAQLINPQAIKVCQVLHQAGHQAFIVGGCVRDLLLGLTPKDWDITTDATPDKVMKLFPKHYPTGLQHGTVTVAMGEGVENHFEVTTFRIEGEYTDGRRPEEVFFVMDVEQDLSRRDLTINAIAYDPIMGMIVDPFQGILDLQKQILRTVGQPESRFKEDGLRIMRVARFAARFGYAVDDATFQGMCDTLETLKKVSKERIQDELCKTLVSAYPSFGLQLLKESGALNIACPFLTSESTYLHFSQFQDRCQGTQETRLAFLYANCQTVEVQKELLSLKFSNKEIKRICFLLDLLDKFQTFHQRGTALSYKSFMAIIKNHSPDDWTYTLEQFLHLTDAIGLPARQLVSKHQEEVVFSKREMKINGDDLLAVGIPPGPQIRNILEECYLEILRHPEHNTKAFLLKRAMGS
jgi:tRNA nucleotidyltransferase (CCA-adding enzyme)